MEEIQHFRLSGTTEIHEIPCNYLDGHNVIYWKDIEVVFPGVQYLKHGNIMVTKLRDSEGKRIKPLCIRHYPGENLDVQLADTSSDVNSALSKYNTHPAPGPLSNTNTGSKDTLSYKQIVDLSIKKEEEAAAEQMLIAPLLSELQKRIRASTNTRDAHAPVVSESLVEPPFEQLVSYESKESIRTIMDLLHKNNELSSGNNDLVSEIMDLADLNMRLESENSELMALIKSQEEHAAKQAEKETSMLEDRLIEVQKIMQPWNQSPDSLALPPNNPRALSTQTYEYAIPQLVSKNNDLTSKNNVRALPTQTYKLHEYPIPRLFIVLPDNRSSWNPMDFFSNKFRLYFLCECGEHTKATNSKIPHHIHLAKHEGYDIDRPNELFQQFGSYVLTILRMLKFGISTAGVAVPALSHLIRVDELDQATKGLEVLKNTMETGMNQVINHIEKTSADDGGAVVGSSEQMESNEALEGADLRQLETFLKNKDSNRVLGNLCRTVTDKGHVKWVCLDHYRENHHEKAKAFRDAVKVLKGSFDENIGRAEVTLPSKVQAKHFYYALEKATSVHQLRVEIDWEATRGDFAKLRDTLAITNISVLELYLIEQYGSTEDLSNSKQLYDPILDIMRCRSIQSFTIRGPRDFSKQSSLLSRNENFTHLQHLDISLHELRNDITGVTHLITKASDLSRLTVGTGGWYGDHDYVLQTYNAIAEHRAYSINFKNWDLYLPPPPPKESDESMAARQCLKHLLKLYCETTSAPYFNRNGQKLIWNTVESLRVPSDEVIGRVEVRLQSSAQAEHFYHALEKARSLHEIKIKLGWIVTQGDLEKLRDSLATVNVGVLELYLIEQYGSTEDLSNSKQLYDPILDIMRCRSIQSFTIRGPRDFSKQSSLLSRNENFTHLQHLDISLHELRNDITGVTHLITKASDLSRLTVGTGGWYGDHDYVLQTYNAIAEHRTYSINFKDWDLCLPPPPPKESDESMAARQCLGHLLAFYCETTSAQYLDRNVLNVFRNVMDSLGGSSDEDISRVEVRLQSSALAQHFYFALEKARSVRELRVEIDWEATQSDFEKLRDTLAITNVGVLELYLKQQDGSTEDLSSRNQLYDPILDIMRYRSIQSFTIRGPRDFSKQSGLLSRNEDFTHLQHLDISLCELKNDIPGVVYLITKASNLSSLAVGTGVLFERHDNRYVLEACNAIAKHRTYPIHFKDLNLVIPPSLRESNQSKTTQQCMEGLLKFYCEHGSGRLDIDSQGTKAVDSLAKAIATTNGSAFKTLELIRGAQLRDSFINNISSIVGRSEFSEITFYTRQNPGRVRILESIQWKHLRTLIIKLYPGTFETIVMRTLVDGVTKMSEKVELDEFVFGGETWIPTPLSLPEGDLLQTFVAAVSFKQLVLHVGMTLEQILSILKSTDFSRLEMLLLWARGFDSVKVDAIIDGVGHATKLSVLELSHATFTDEQERRMGLRGITLRNQ